MDPMLIEGIQLWVYRREMQAFLRQRCGRWPPATSDPLQSVNLVENRHSISVQNLIGCCAAQSAPDLNLQGRNDQDGERDDLQKFNAAIHEVASRATASRPRSLIHGLSSREDGPRLRVLPSLRTLDNAQGPGLWSVFFRDKNVAI